VHQFGHQLLFLALHSGLEHHKAHRNLTLEIVVHTQYRAFSDVGMLGQNFLHTPCGEPVTGHVDHVIRAPHDPNVAVLIDESTIPGEVVSRIRIGI